MRPRGDDTIALRLLTSTVFCLPKNRGLPQSPDSYPYPQCIPERATTKLCAQTTPFLNLFRGCKLNQLLLCVPVCQHRRGHFLKHSNWPEITPHPHNSHPHTRGTHLAAHCVSRMIVSSSAVACSPAPQDIHTKTLTLQLPPQQSAHSSPVLPSASVTKRIFQRPPQEYRPKNPSWQARPRRRTVGCGVACRR